MLDLIDHPLSAHVRALHIENKQLSNRIEHYENKRPDAVALKLIRGRGVPDFNAHPLSGHLQFKYVEYDQ